MVVVSLDLHILAPNSTSEPCILQNLPGSYGNAFEGSPASQNSSPNGLSAEQEDFNTARVTANTMGAGSPIWSAVPRYTPPTTPIDSLIVNLIESRKLNYQHDADIREFSHKNFPSVNSLLNPSVAEPDEPVASTIARHVVGIIRVHTLPEKLAVRAPLFVLTVE